MAAYSVNESGVARARGLIEARQYVLKSDWGEAAGGLPAGAALLGLLAAAVTARLAGRATPASALRVRD